MRRVGALLVALASVTMACGAGSGPDAGRSPRGTIDGVALHPPSGSFEPPTTRPPYTFPDITLPPFTIPPTAPPTTAPPPGTLAWTEFGAGLDEAYLEVPLDYDDPHGDTILLYVVRHRASDPRRRIGSLLVNPGGPGTGGSNLAWSAEFVYGDELLERFDIIGWDPRGTGFSEPAIDCVDNYDQYFSLDSSPDDEAERTRLVATARAFARQCELRSADLLPFVGTQSSARDMEAIRLALGEPQISYFGFSYGSELGATWATLFPTSVRAAVLDGAVDPTVGYFEQNLQQAAGFEAALSAFLAGCSADPDCPFHNDGDAEGAFDALAAALDADPIAIRGRLAGVNQGVLFQAVAGSLYLESDWQTLADALADAQDGDGELLLWLYDAYLGISNGMGYLNDAEAYFAINCFDDPGSTGPEELFARAGELAAVAPRIGPAYLAELTFCAVWPAGPAVPLPLTAKGAGPILVVGTTGDPATPLASTRAMARALEDGRLVVVDALQHTGYGTNACVDRAVEAYLVDPSTAPGEELRCD